MTSPKPPTPSKAALTWSIVLGILLIPLVALGLVDPLEGLAALVAGVVLLVVVRVVSKVRIPRLAWIPMTVAVLLMAVMLTIAFTAPADQSVMVEDASLANPLALIGLVVMWPQRLAILVMVAGLIVYVVRLVRARRAST